LPLTIGDIELRRLAKILQVTSRAEQQAASDNGKPASTFRATEDEFTGFIRALNKYFLPQSSKEMNRGHFGQSKQTKQETTGQFYARL